MLPPPMRRPGLAGLALGGAAFAFGITFVVIKDAVSTFPPLAFVGWRFVVGAAVLTVLVVPRGGRLWRDAVVVGTLLFAGYALQTVGLTSTGASNSALITGLYVVFTPLLTAAYLRRRPSPWVVVGSVVAFIGLALLTVETPLDFNLGDLATLGCALAFAAHIVALARTARRHPVIPFTAAQLAITGVLGLVLSVPIEGLPLPSARVWPALAVTGVAVSAGAFLAQVWAQTQVGPGRTAVILALEPAFGVGAAAVVLGERLDFAGWSGAALIVAAIYLVVVTGRQTDLVEAEAVTAAH